MAIIGNINLTFSDKPNCVPEHQKDQNGSELTQKSCGFEPPVPVKLIKAGLAAGKLRKLPAFTAQRWQASRPSPSTRHQEVVHSIYMGDTNETQMRHK